MTLAIYISPKSIPVPIIITDTLITKGRDDLHEGLATRSEDIKRNIETNLNSLARKYVILNDKTAMEFAGYFDDILDFLQYADNALLMSPQERPLKAIAERASGYRSGGLDVISCKMDENGNLHKVKPNRLVEWEVEEFGYITYIGSGSEYIIEKIRKVSKMNMFQGNIDYKNAMNLAIYLCIHALYEEIYMIDSGVLDNPSWGGLLEYIYLDPIDNVWRRQPPTAYVFYRYDIDCDGKAKGPYQTDKMFLYEPGIETGWLHVCRRSIRGSNNINYRISSTGRDRHNVGTFLWKKWIPERVCICVAAFKEDSDSETDGKRAPIGQYMGYYQIDEYNGVDLEFENYGVVPFPFGEQLEDILTNSIRSFAHFR